MPGGVPQKPSEKAKTAICYPNPPKVGLPIEIYPFVEAAAVHYQMQAAHSAQAPVPREVKAMLQRLAEQSGALHVNLRTLPEEGRHALLDVLPAENSHQLMDQLDTLAGWFMGAARNAMLAAEAPAGRPTPPEHDLVRRLANLMEGHGLQADGAENGLLVHVTYELLKEYRAMVGDVPRLVRRVLAKT